MKRGWNGETWWYLEGCGLQCVTCMTYSKSSTSPWRWLQGFKKLQDFTMSKGAKIMPQKSWDPPRSAGIYIYIYIDIWHHLMHYIWNSYNEGSPSHHRFQYYNGLMTWMIWGSLHMETSIYGWEQPKPPMRTWTCCCHPGLNEPQSTKNRMIMGWEDPKIKPPSTFWCGSKMCGVVFFLSIDPENCSED